MTRRARLALRRDAATRSRSVTSRAIVISPTNAPCSSSNGVVLRSTRMVSPLFLRRSVVDRGRPMPGANPLEKALVVGLGEFGGMQLAQRLTDGFLCGKAVQGSRFPVPVVTTAFRSLTITASPLCSSTCARSRALASDRSFSVSGTLSAWTASIGSSLCADVNARMCGASPNGLVRSRTGFPRTTDALPFVY